MAEFVKDASDENREGVRIHWTPMVPFVGEGVRAFGCGVVLEAVIPRHLMIVRAREQVQLGFDPKVATCPVKNIGAQLLLPV